MKKNDDTYIGSYTTIKIGVGGESVSYNISSALRTRVITVDITLVCKYPFRTFLPCTR